MVFIYLGDEAFIEAVTPEAAYEEVEMNCSGQLGRFSARQLVSLDDALIAAAEYHRTGQRATSLTWIVR